MSHTNIDYLTSDEIVQVMVDCAQIDQHIGFVAAHKRNTGTIIPCRATLGFWEQWRLDLRKDILSAMDEDMNPDHMVW